MQFSVSQERFARALSRVCSATARADSQRGSEDITTHILLEVKAKDRLEISATDLSTIAHAVVPISKGKVGACTAPATLLNSSVSSLPRDTDLEVSLDNQEVVLKCGRSTFSLSSLAADDYPGFRETLSKDATAFSLPAATLRALFSNTLPCSADNVDRYYLTGVYLHVQEDKLRAAATDGFRLALASLAVPKGAEKMKGIIIPRKAVQALLQLVDEASLSGGDTGAVKIESDEATARFTLENASLSTKFIDGAFPDYTRVIPKNNDSILTLDPTASARTLKRALIIANQNNQGVAVHLALSKDGMSVSAAAPSLGKYDDMVDVEYKADDLQIAFNGVMLLDLLRQFSDEPSPHEEDAPEDEQEDAQEGKKNGAGKNGSGTNGAGQNAHKNNGAGKLCVKFLDNVSPLLMHAPGAEESLIYVLMPLRT